MNNDENKGVLIWRDWHMVLWRRYKLSWFDRHFRLSAPIAIVLFAISVFVNAVASSYATEKASNSVTDIILSNTPAIDVDWVIVYGMVALIAFTTALCIMYPKRIPFTLHSLSLFLLIRSLFISLTHLGPFPIQSDWDFQSKVIFTIFGGGDYFFSGHTGGPFLLALIYWHNKRLRYIFFITSIFFAGTVLLGHLHYSIDVLAAFFITYTIYQIALYFFPKERLLFLEDETREN